MTDHKTLLERAAFWLEHEGHEGKVCEIDRLGVTIPALVTKADTILVGWAMTHARLDIDGDLIGPKNWLPLYDAKHGVYTI